MNPITIIKKGTWLNIKHLTPSKTETRFFSLNGAEFILLRRLI